MQQEYQSHKWNTHSHTETQICPKSFERMTDAESKKKKKHFSSTFINDKYMAEPISKMPKRHSVLTNDPLG